MTKKEVIRNFQESILPCVRKLENKYRQGRCTVDIIMRRGEWNNYTDMLCKDGNISLHQYETWDNPF